MDKNWKGIITNKKILSTILVAIILIIIILLLITFNTNRMISKTNNEKKQEQELEFEWEVTQVEGNMYGLLIVFRNEKGIKEVHYPKQNENEEEMIVYANGKYNVAIDYTVEKLKTYQFNVKFEDETTKTYEITYTPPPPSIEVGGETHTAKQIQYTWEELNSIAKFISDNYGLEEGQINNDTIEVNVNINGKSDTLGIGDWTTVNGKQVRILGFNHDELVTTTTDEEGNEQTISQYGEGTTNVYAGISFEFVDCLGTAQMNNNAYILDGWGACSLRGTLNSTTYNSLENREYIKEVNKQYIKVGKVGDDANSVTTSQDKLWMLSSSEVWEKSADGTYGHAKTKEGDRYRYYENINPKTNQENTCLVKKNNGTAIVWWLRSSSRGISQGGSYLFYNMATAIANNGNIYGRYGVEANTVNGVAPGFAI